MAGFCHLATVGQPASERVDRARTLGGRSATTTRKQTGNRVVTVRTISLGQAAQRAHTTKRMILNLIEDRILPAAWTRYGWYMDPAAVDMAVDEAKEYARLPA